MSFEENSSSGIEPTHYRNAYNVASQEWNKKIPSGAYFDPNLKDAFCQIYAEIYFRTQGLRSNRNGRYGDSNTSDMELKNWAYSRYYLLQKYNNTRPNLTQEALEILLDDLFKKILKEEFPIEFDPEYEMPEDQKERLIERLSDTDLPIPMEDIADNWGFTGGAAPIQTDPLLIDLNGDGIKTTGTIEGEFFDHTVDGFRELSAWVSKDDGILFVDKNSNGLIDNGSELFGENYTKTNGLKATSGFDALSDMDSNDDGVIDNLDSNFSNIKIQKGDGTVLSLNEVGITSFNLDYINVNRKDENGNTQIESGSYIKADNTSGELGSFILQSDKMNTVATESLAVSSDVEILPYLRGYGKLYDLHQAIMRDETGELKTLIETFISSSTSESSRDSLLDQILFKWTNCHDVAEDSRGANINAKQLETLEAFIGEKFYSVYDYNANLEMIVGASLGSNAGVMTTELAGDIPINIFNPNNPNLNAGNMLKSIYQNLKNYVYAELISQSTCSDLVELINFTNKGLDLASVIYKLKQEIEENSV